MTVTISKAGRPSKYDERYIDTVYEYLKTVGHEQQTLPTIQGFAIYIHVNTDTIVEWCKVHPRFSVAINYLMGVQAQQLINDGVYGGKEINPTIVKLLLMNNHGMRERTDVTSADDKLAPMVSIDTKPVTKK